jgi:predicted AAA+ superfamily ATPase
LKSYINTDEKVFHHYRGGLAEQFVLQELKAAHPHLPIFYWANDKNTAEMDFVIQYNNTVIPIEVKAGENIQGKSLKTYLDTFKPEIAIRSSLLDYNRNNTLYDIPLYMIQEFTASTL